MVGTITFISKTKGIQNISSFMYGCRCTKTGEPAWTKKLIIIQISPFVTETRIANYSFTQKMFWQLVRLNSLSYAHNFEAKSSNFFDQIKNCGIFFIKAESKKIMLFKNSFKTRARGFNFEMKSLYLAASVSVCQTVFTFLPRAMSHCH